MKLRFLCEGIVASFCVFLLYSCANPVSPKKPSNYIQGNTYISNDIKMQIIFPNGWAFVQDTTMSNTLIPLVATKSTYTQFRPNFFVIWQDHGGTANLNEVLDTMSAQAMGTLQSPSIVSKQLVQIDGNSFGELVFVYTYSGTILQEKQLYFIHNNKDITMCFTDLKTNYPTDSTDFNSIENSMTVQ